MSKFDIFNEYFAFGTSAMCSAVESGIIRGRPFGGVMTLVHNDIRNITETVFSSERCIIISVYDVIIINVYLPCVGTTDRLLIIESIFYEISEYVDQYSCSEIIIGGDFNCDLDVCEPASNAVNSFIQEYKLQRCDIARNYPKTSTYCNLALNCSSCIDYFLASSVDKVNAFKVIDEGSNLSDHLPITISYNCAAVASQANGRVSVNVAYNTPKQTYLRWDHADTGSYYYVTGIHLQSLLSELDSYETALLAGNMAEVDAKFVINSTYCEVVNILRRCASYTVPSRTKQFYKFWWNEELDILKDESIKDHQVWKAAGKPRCGELFQKYKSSKLAYKLRIRECQDSESLLTQMNYIMLYYKKKVQLFGNVGDQNSKQKRKKLTVLMALSAIMK
jgi:hypothetical protein